MIVVEIIEDGEIRFWGSRVGSMGNVLPVQSHKLEFRSPAAILKVSIVECTWNPRAAWTARWVDLRTY